MRSIKTLGFACLALIFSINVSCSKDDDGGSSGAAAAGTIEANIEGADAFKTETMLTSATRVETGSTGATVSITGNTTNGRNMTLTINGFEGEGTYDIGGDNLVFVVASYTEVDVNNPSDAESWVAPYTEDVNGEINISASSDTNIQGTFNFTGKSNQNESTKAITNGSFNVDF